MARLVSDVEPTRLVPRVRRRLPLRLSVFTLRTSTPQMAWTASRISGLLADGCTLNV